MVPYVLEPFIDLEIAIDRTIAICRSNDLPITGNKTFKILPLDEDEGWVFLDEPDIYVAILTKTPITDDVKKFTKSFFDNPSNKFSSYQKRMNELKLGSLDDLKEENVQDIMDFIMRKIQKPKEGS